MLLPRREFFQAGALALGGVTLPQILAARALGQHSVTNTSVILLYLHGGPSQLETYDLKPQAPSEYRSVFGPIPTIVPGLDLCEHFPLQARIADKFSLIRSVHHTMSSHSDGGIEVLTGKTPAKPDPTSTSKSEHPDFASIASRMRGVRPDGLPQYVAVPRQLYMTRPAYLGLHHGPFVVNDPESAAKTPVFSLATGADGERLNGRRDLIRQFDVLRSGTDRLGNLEGHDRFRDVAFQMLTSSSVAAAFDLGQEPDSLRERYGRHLWGQSCLLARRLAEAGTAAITIYIDTPKSGQEFTNWDDHILNAGRPGHFAEYMQRRLPYLDQALSALIEDIFARSLERQIMVVVTGEFGRTPRLSRNASGVGRDHWPDASSVLISGGGLKMGQAIGATNSKAEYPTERPLSPKDVLATVYRHLGIDGQFTFTDPTGRPVPVLSEGQPISELL